MTTDVFVDSAAWIALFDKRDSLHEPARQVLIEHRRNQSRLVTTDFVLLEVANAFAAPATRVRITAFINGLRSQPDLRIVPADPGLLAEGWLLFSQRQDKAWGLTDCTSFALMTREKIQHAFTSDHHFEQAGFVKLLTN
jgi:predicted nucleic acid-binding protein